MDLKNIHVLFISLATALCLVFGAWCISAYRSDGDAGYLLGGISSFASAAGLVVYGGWFLRKMKGIGGSS